MNKKKIVSITAVATAFAVLCTAGVTLALGLSDNKSKGSITTANLELAATAKNVKVFSAVKAPSDAQGEGVFYDEYSQAYQYEQSVAQGGDGVMYFSRHDGGVSFNDKSLTVTNVMPGDKVEFDIEVTCSSTISFNYRAELYVDASQGQTLLNQLDFSAGELGILRKDVADVEEGLIKEAVLTDYTQWTTYSSTQSNVESVHVSVSMPITATEGQGESVKLYYLASGIQNTEQQEDVASVSTPDGQKHEFKTLAEAVDFAQDSGVKEIKVVGSTVLEEGTVRVSDALRFTGVPDGDGVYPVLNGARFIIDNYSEVTFSGINFDGASYIDVSRAMGLTLTDCKANVRPDKYFDEYTRSYLEDGAFIVSGSSLTPIRLTLNKNEIKSVGGCAVVLRSPVNNSSITDNVFGSEDRAFTGSAVLCFNGADSNSTVISVKDNQFYGNCAMSLGGAGMRYLTLSQNNKAYNVKDVFAKGSAVAAFADSGSTTDGKALACGDINYGSMAFGAVDVVLNDLNRIAAGKIALSENFGMNDFYTGYVVGSTLENNAITIFKDGKAYAYLNKADNDAGYVLNVIGGN